MEHIPASHAAVVGMRYPGRVVNVYPDGLILDLDLILFAPGRSPSLRARLNCDETVAVEKARSLTPNDSLEVVLIWVDRDLGNGWFEASLPAPSEWLTWNDETVRRLARHIRVTREFSLLPILADALEDAGCTDEALLTHCREARPEASWSWAVELLATQQ